MSGTTIITDNLLGTSGNFIGAKPASLKLDSLIIGGKDQLKKKIDEGYLVVATDNSQIKFIRSIGINGRGMYLYPAGQEPLSGFTLPAVFILKKVEIPKVIIE